MKCVFKKHVNLLYEVLMRNVVICIILEVYLGNITNDLRKLEFQIQYKVSKVNEKFEKLRNPKKNDKFKKHILGEKEIGDVMIEFYLNQKQNNTKIIDLYHVSGFFEFLNFSSFS